MTFRSFISCCANCLSCGLAFTSSTAMLCYSVDASYHECIHNLDHCFLIIPSNSYELFLYIISGMSERYMTGVLFLVSIILPVHLFTSWVLNKNIWNGLPFFSDDPHSIRPLCLNHLFLGDPYNNQFHWLDKAVVHANQVG